MHSLRSLFRLMVIATLVVATISMPFSAWAANCNFNRSGCDVTVSTFTVVDPFPAPFCQFASYVGVRVTLSCPGCSYTSPTKVVCAESSDDAVFTACGSTITVSLHPNTTWQQSLSNCDIINVTLTQ